MTFLIYDTTFEGFLTAVFDVYDLKLKEIKIRKNTIEIPQMFSQVIEINTDEVKAKRVADKLIEILGKKGLNSLWKATLIESENIEDTLFSVIQYALKTKKNILGDYGYLPVLDLQQMLKKLSRERHRMTAFVRFQLAKDGIYYATIEPDFDVVPLISKHFKNRYADQKWLIYDTKRNYGIYSDLQQVIQVVISEYNNSYSPSVLEIKMDETEAEYQELWKSYFKSTNIKSRKNTKLHLQHVPKRYWKYLVEKS